MHGLWIASAKSLAKTDIFIEWLTGDGMARIYTVAIIGAGKIGCGFDSPDSLEILTHAHAVLKNSRMKLVAFVDSDARHGKQEAKRWKTKYYSDLRKMFAEERPDIVIISTPDKTHAPMLISAAKYGPKIIICEKPITASAKELKKIKSLRIPIIVNFSRRFDSKMQALRRDIFKKNFGKIISATGIYTKGLFHNGSHMLDLAWLLFGEMKSCSAQFQNRDWAGDPSIGGIAVFERCPEFHLRLGDARAFAIFELDILTEKKRIRIVDEGRTILTQDVIADPLYKGFKILSRERSKKSNLDCALTELYKHAANVLDGKETSRSTLDNALKTEETCARLARTWRNSKFEHQ